MHGRGKSTAGCCDGCSNRLSSRPRKSTLSRATACCSRSDCCCWQVPMEVTAASSAASSAAELASPPPSCPDASATSLCTCHATPRPHRPSPQSAFGVPSASPVGGAVVDEAPGSAIGLLGALEARSPARQEPPQHTMSCSRFAES